MSSLVTSYPVTQHSDLVRPLRSGSDSRQSSFSWSEEQGANTWFTAGLPTPPSTKAMPGVTVDSQFPNYAGVNNFSRGRLPQQNYVNSGSSYLANSSNSHIPPQGILTGKSRSDDSRVGRKDEPSRKQTIAPYLQIPESVNKSKGSIADLAAEITCLFWFESAPTIQQIEDLTVDAIVDRPLTPDATPSVGFRKWVTTILSTTQVGRNVILLALMFIYRLKKFNPSVSGKRGSEFRLLTIALMLGNKFLDDNTYTNKTWAEVSGISVPEIHIMEVEFLSNMRYNLYSSSEQWQEWQKKLGRFGAYYEKAAKLPQAGTPVTPSSSTFSQKLHSPVSIHRGSTSPNGPGTTHTSYPVLPNPLNTMPHLPQSPARLHRVPSIETIDRKRSFDASSDLPAAKRVHYSGSNHASSGLGPLVSTANSGLLTGSQDFYEGGIAGHVPRLGNLRIPMPNPSIINPGPLSLPTTRAMNSVYPIPTADWSQPTTPLSAIPSNLFQNVIPNLGEAQRALSNYGSANTSPNGYGAMTPIRAGQSPSYFLTNRSSPYRPVRHVNTLLIPPPIGALQNPVRSVGREQIHYQPLSKTGSERYTGPVPLLHHDNWTPTAGPSNLAHQYFPYQL